MPSLAGPVHDHHTGTYNVRRLGGWVGRHRRGNRRPTNEEMFRLQSWQDRAHWDRRSRRRAFWDRCTATFLDCAAVVFVGVVALALIAQVVR